MKQTLALLFITQTLFASAGFAASVRWNANAFTFTTKENTPFTWDLARYVTNPFGAPLIFARATTATASWINVSPDGKATGTPTSANVGKNVISVRVSAGTDAGSIAQVTVMVIGGAKPSLVCGDGSPAYLVGHTEDRSQEIFSCKH
jgi:hypothetical protein